MSLSGHILEEKTEHRQLFGGGVDRPSEMLLPVFDRDTDTLGVCLSRVGFLTFYIRYKLEGHRRFHFIEYPHRPAFILEHVHVAPPNAWLELP